MIKNKRKELEMKIVICQNIIDKQTVYLKYLFEMDDMYSTKEQKNIVIQLSELANKEIRNRENEIEDIKVCLYNMV